MTIWARASRLVLCCVTTIAISGPATACSVDSMEKHMEAGAASVRNFWLASILVGGLILCLDLYERKVSVPLLVTTGLLLLGWLLYRTPHWGFYMPSCEPFLLAPVQLVLGLIAALLAYRVFRAIRSS